MKGKVRFFCACGREMWQQLSEAVKDGMTIAQAEATCQCSDCILKEIKEKANA